ncbi:hypothetical protein BGW36DRAFT_438671 [Talaromyces proteolyticus]|uniref:Uncharacterized protein n=1 Tax=Talaromyces proteolyticus TaxID=1131652 RepID=A0AAD4PVB1_9EURO|nr:uncharacterized protein BGW36DRAFT_438671 [Talaromyces proteolyticus]KAH8691163.1 hypothetical protein BGW36DRAFT_438671 [Talaromyces proteolyticus]
MDDVQHLDLSDVSESFRSQIKEYSTHSWEFVNYFKRAIDKYEKSMGKSSQRRFLTSAPRKVQWAFNAADDLEKFRQSLSAQLNLVHITISKSILSIVARSNQSQQLLPGPARSNAFSREIYPASHKQGYLDWNYIQIDSVDMLDRVDDITDLVYKSLLARSGLSLTNHGRVHTLPDDASMSVSYPQLETLSDGRTPPFTDHSNEFPILNQQDIELTNKRTYSGHQDTLVSEINEYLRSLSLEELSEQEAEHVNQIEKSSEISTQWTWRIHFRTAPTTNQK